MLDKPAELLEINPRGQVPALVDGDVALYDSTVINEYLDARYPEPALLPSETVARARARQLEDHGDWLMAGCVGDLISEAYRKPDPAARDAAKLAAASAAIRSEFDRLERALAGHEWLADDFGLADVACFVPVSIAAAFGAPPEARHRNVASWLARCTARASIAQQLANLREALAKLPD